MASEPRRGEYQRACACGQLAERGQPRCSSCQRLYDRAEWESSQRPKQRLLSYAELVQQQQRERELRKRSQAAWQQTLERREAERRERRQRRWRWLLWWRSG